jgi:hypothetical protein
VSKKIQHKLNKDKPSFFDNFLVTSLKLEKNPAKINGIKPLRSEPFEFLADIDFEYDGMIELVIDTSISLKLGRVGLADCSRTLRGLRSKSSSVSTKYRL